MAWKEVKVVHLVIMSFTVCETFLLVVTSSKERFLTLGADKVLKEKTSLLQQTNSWHHQKKCITIDLPLELYQYRFFPIIPIPNGTDDSNSRYRLCGRLLEAN